MTYVRDGQKDKDGNPLVIQTATSDIKILRIMSKREQEDLLKLINAKENPNSNNSSEASGDNMEDNEITELLEPVGDLEPYDSTAIDSLPVDKTTVKQTLRPSTATAAATSASSTEELSDMYTPAGRT